MLSDLGDIPFSWYGKKKRHLACPADCLDNSFKLDYVFAQEKQNTGEICSELVLDLLRYKSAPTNENMWSWMSVSLLNLELTFENACLNTEAIII